MAGALARSRGRLGGLVFRRGHDFLSRDDARRGGLCNRLRGAFDIEEAGLVLRAEVVLQRVFGHFDFQQNQSAVLAGELFCRPCCHG